MKKRWLRWLVCLALLLPLTTATVYADCGPKPSIRIHTEGGQVVYVTILAEYPQIGPNQAIEPGAAPESWQFQMDSRLDTMAWNAFRDHSYPENCYFMGEMGQGGASWTYICPSTFRIGVYSPEHDTVLVSQEIFETYAFHSDFVLEVSSLDLSQSGVCSMTLREQIDYAGEISGFALRAALTLVVELAVAWLFGYRKAEQIRLILFVNLVTQVGLNAMLSVWYFFDGSLNAMIRLFFAELVVLAVELVFYCRRLRCENRAGGWAALYAVAANLASVYIGWIMIEA